MIEGGLDIALMVIMGYFFLRGIFRGVVKEVVAVLGLFVAFWVASVYWPLGEEHLKAIFDLEGQRGIISFVFIFFVVYFLISVISIFIDKIIKLTISPVISALLGAVVGTVKGILVCSVILIGAETFIKPTESFFTKSEMWPYFQPVTKQAREWMPEALRRALKTRINLPIIGEIGGDSGGSAPSLLPAPGSLDAMNWETIQNLLTTRAEAITPAWREKLQSLTSGESLSPDDLKKFIADHPNLFPRSSDVPANPPGAAPTWAQPASE